MLRKAFSERDDGTDTAECTKIKWIKNPVQNKKRPKKKRKSNVSIFSWFGSIHSEINNDFIVEALADIYEEAYTLFTQN